MNITLQDPRRCQSKQNSFPHQQDKHAKRGGRRGGKVRERRERERGAERETKREKKDYSRKAWVVND